MRIIICGSRDFNDKRLLYSTMDKLTSKLDDFIVVTGGAKGADKLGENWALENGFSVQIFHPDWDKYGKSAGPIRNSEMLDSCKKSDVLVAFYDGSSPGTRDIIHKARHKGMTVRVIKYEER